MVSLKIIDNNIVTTTLYPVGVRKFAKWHRQISRTYDTYLNTETLNNNHTFLQSKFVNLMGLNLWTGANITQKKVGKHKIPRFLYHKTTKDNYNKMLQDGYIQISESCQRGKGLYMFEMQNMLKHYKDFDGKRDLGRLLNQVIGNSIYGAYEAVLLRIPTSILDAGKLAIRSNSGPGRNSMHSCTKTALGDSALASHLHKQRKVALEYIYPNQLPMDNISVVGAVKFNSKDAENLDESKALELWKELTKNQPENKGVLNHIFKKETYQDFIPQIKKRKDDDIKLKILNATPLEH